MFDVPMNSSGAVSMNGMLGGASNTIGNPGPSGIGQTQVLRQQQVQPQVQQSQQNRSVQSHGVSLRKGQKHALTANGNPLDQLRLQLDWDTGSTQVDLDTSVFMLGADDKVIGDKWFVYYHALMSPDGSIRHHGDNRDGSGDIDEVIDIGLSVVDRNVQKLALVVTINDEDNEGINFRVIHNGVVKLINRANNVPMANYHLEDCDPNSTSMLIGEIVRQGNQWIFNPMGVGYNMDLYGLCAMYGVNVAD